MNLRLHLLTPLLLTMGALAWLAHMVIEEAPVRVFLEGPRVQFEPGAIRVRVRVEPHPDNRGLTVAAISEGYSRSSFEQLEGAASPRTRWVSYPDIPAGEYDIIAQLSRVSGEAADRASLSVLGRGF